MFFLKLGGVEVFVVCVGFLCFAFSYESLQVSPKDPRMTEI